ncbi:murein hydrolase activator EnvC family protein [Paracerasibacillus soli]|uniref:Peptidoglycan DD-metalloendopeptidase family protein n=2 Tax=Paracerasibacillus soli TaxID=480284 RepID=A0ABU5CRA7_9BACI|nr:peptidoglycan DD-metalloendopeptidase family protein [Virgibacillus soli]MDY0408906.1 peptidoglycan DD-metalloendopeptidase family protein [Virgibacillus soli]
MSIAILILVFMTGTMNLTYVDAKSVDDVTNKINDINKEKEKVNKQKDNIDTDQQNTKKKIDENLNKQKSVKNDIETVDEKLNKTKSKVQAKENEIIMTNQEITSLQEEITRLNRQVEDTKIEIQELEASIERREEILKERLRSMQQTGGQMTYIEVLLGSKSFSDFISRSTAVTKIMDSDQSIMEALEDDRIELQIKKVQLEEKTEEVKRSKKKVEIKKSELEEQKQELNTLKKQLDKQLAEKKIVQKKLKKEQKELEEYKISLEDEKEILQKQAVALEKAKKLAEQEKKNIEEQEKRERQRAKNNNNHSGGSKTPPNVGSSGNGLFRTPVPYCYTSPFGYRWGKLHRGLDFRSSIGTSVSAAASGVVSQVNTEHDGKMNGYGNVILISHYINGVSYTTLYAHLSSIHVHEGQAVSAGQAIGLSGNTGGNYAPHLHFEIHRGGWSGDSNAVNPLGTAPNGKSYLPHVNYCY